MNDKGKEILNQEFDDMRLSVQFALEDLVKKFDKFYPVFASDTVAEEIKQELTAMLSKVSKY